MGRVTEAISFINKETVPTPLETKHFYTHISREELMKLRRKHTSANIEPKGFTLFFGG